jgi:tetratricopeptide (TPR) repeat protein/transcriptional regulator with XRE-family HTH domain
VDVPGTPKAGFGELLRRLRTAAGFTQEELAERATLSPRSVSDLERGINQTPRRETARLLAEALGLQGAVRSEFEAVARGRAPVPAEQTAATATRTLPRDITVFTGREAELLKLTGTDGPSIVSIHAIGGMAGVGKTALAVHAAHQLAGRFPDGQYFLQLHAHTPGRKPVEPLDALASLLLTAGIPAVQIPDGLEARSARWRDHLADKAVLLVLDDAAGHDQVIPLLPGSGGSMVLITGRRHLTALDDAVTISLDVLAPEHAAELLIRLAGRPGLQPEDPAVAHVVQLCGYLPLAIGMLARQIHHHPSWTVADLVEDLSQARDRLELMRAENLSVAAAFDLSYSDLTPGQQLLFRRLGLRPGLEVDAYAAAALCDEPLPTARAGLHDLYDHYLLTEPAHGRYRLHDLLGQHAASLASTDPPEDQGQAAGRLFDYYQHTARLAAGQLGESRQVTVVAGPVPAAVPALPDRDRAWTWLATERPNLLACVDEVVRDRLDARVVALALAVEGFLREDGAWSHARTVLDSAIASAGRLGDRRAEAAAIASRGVIRRLTGDYAGAVDDFERALATDRELGEQWGEADALCQLGTVLRFTGDYSRAAALFEDSLELFLALGSQAGQAGTLSEIGSLRSMTGDLPSAKQSVERALAIYTDIADRRGQAKALYQLAAVQQLSGSYQEASALLGRALGISRDLGDRLGQARTLHMRGVLRCTLGEYPAATSDLEQALALHEALSQRSGQANALCTLGIARYLTGQYPAAEQVLEESLRLCRSIGYRLGEANAQTFLGMVHTRTGDYTAASASFDEALDIYLGMGDRLGEANVLNVLGELLRRTGDYSAAATALDRSIGIYREIGNPGGEAEAYIHLGALWLDRGDSEQARRHYQKAMDHMGQDGAIIDRGRVLEGIGRCDLAEGRTAEGAAALRQALAIYERLGAAEAARLAAELHASP